MSETERPSWRRGLDERHQPVTMRTVTGFTCRRLRGQERPKLGVGTRVWLLGGDQMGCDNMVPGSHVYTKATK